MQLTAAKIILAGGALLALAVSGVLSVLAELDEHSRRLGAGVLALMTGAETEPSRLWVTAGALAWVGAGLGVATIAVLLVKERQEEPAA